MDKFKVGDRVRVSETLDCQEYGIEDDIRGKIGKVTSTNFWEHHALVRFEDLVRCWYVRNQHLTKIEDKETTEMCKFSVGDTVRTKGELEHIRGKIPEGTIGKKVVNCDLENLLIRMHGAEHEVSVFEFGGMRLLALNSEVEKVEAPKTEESSSELYEYTFYFMTDKMPMKFRGKYVSADAEFEYYETEDDREIEVRSASIEVKTSRKVR